MNYQEHDYRAEENLPPVVKEQVIIYTDDESIDEERIWDYFHDVEGISEVREIFPCENGKEGEYVIEFMVYEGTEDRLFEAIRKADRNFPYGGALIA